MKKSSVNKHTVIRKTVFIIVFVIFTLYSAALIYPFIWAFLNSLKINDAYFSDPFGLPSGFLISNYVKAFQSINMRVGTYKYIGLGEMFANSLWLTLGGSFLSIMSSTMISYVVSKYEFKLRGLLYSIAVFIMIIPVVGSLPAQYRLYGDLKLNNSPLILISYTGGFGFNFIVLYAYFKNLSWTYAEAAFVDGARSFRVFISVMLPQAMPAVASVFIIQVVGLWNDFMTPLLYLTDYPTLSSGLYIFKVLMDSGGTPSDYPLFFAGILISTAPVLVLFGLFSNTIMQNTVAGGLKG